MTLSITSFAVMLIVIMLSVVFYLLLVGCNNAKCRCAINRVSRANIFKVYKPEPSPSISIPLLGGWQTSKPFIPFSIMAFSTLTISIMPHSKTTLSMIRLKILKLNIVTLRIIVTMCHWANQPIALNVFTLNVTLQSVVEASCKLQLSRLCSGHICQKSLLSLTKLAFICYRNKCFHYLNKLAYGESCTVNVYMH